MAPSPLFTGLDLLVADPALLRGRRYAVLTNQAAVTGELVPAWLALAAAAGPPVRLFAPEHGLWGVAQDMEAVEPEVEPSLGAPIGSLYGHTAETLAPHPADVDDLDVMVVDLPDVGCRYYTFAATMAHTMAACERAGVEMIVCDRPNPINGLDLEGGAVEPGCRSFVSELPTPVRHGLTLGELALLLRAERHPGLTLAVLPCRGWERSRWWDETGLPWVTPSPNMPTLLTATLYPGACLVEATNLSEGRGTTRPFQLVGAPWVDGAALKQRLNKLSLPGVAFRATRFRPAFQKHAGEECGGVEWHVTDRTVFRPLATGVAVLREVRALRPREFSWRSEAYEFVSGVPAIDLLTGSAQARGVVEGRLALDEVSAGWSSACAEFRERRREHLLYPEADAAAPVAVKRSETAGVVKAERWPTLREVASRTNATVRGAVAHTIKAGREAFSRAVGGARRHPWLFGSLLLYAALLLVLRPASPFEWDEVLFQRSLDDYNIARHSPHPPGYPLYVGVAKAIRFVVRDPLLALQLVAVMAALAALVLVYRWVVRLGGATSAGIAAAALLATMPSFAFHSNLGLSDVPGVAACLAALCALTAAIHQPRWLPWSAVAVAAAFAVRPALLPALLPLAAVAIWRSVRTRSWRALALSVAVALLVTAVIWLPAVWATGPEYWGAWKRQATYAADIGRTQRLPGASPSVILPLWLVRPFGSVYLAAGFWLLVAAGIVMWLRAGHRRLVAAAGFSALAYLAACFFALEAYIGVRYVLPAVPLLAILAAGVTTARNPLVRRLAVALVAVWCGAAVAWAGPTLLLRRQPAPVWAALSWVRDNSDPARTTVVYDGSFEPHVYYLLGKAGFTIVESTPTVPYGGWLRPDGTVLYVSPKPVPGGEVLFQSHWDSEKLRQLTRNRYHECAIIRAPAKGEPVFSPNWWVRETDWELSGTGAICLADDAAPRVVRVAAGDGQLRLRWASALPVTVKPGTVEEAMVMPGAAGCVLINGPSGVHFPLPPVELVPVRAGEQRDQVSDALVIPLIAHLDDPDGTRWRSDVSVSNLGTTPLALVAQYLPGNRDNSAAPAIGFTLAGATTYTVADVVATTGLERWGGAGALLIYSDEKQPRSDPAPGSLMAFSRTYDANARRAGPFLGEGLPALAARRGTYGGGIAAFEHVSNDDRYHSYVSISTWIPKPVGATVTLRDRDKKVVGRTEIEIPPFGQKLVAFPGVISDGQLLVQLVKPPAAALFYPVVTMVETATGAPTHLLGTPSKKEGQPEWLLTRPQRLPAGGPQPAAQPAPPGQAAQPAGKPQR